jgi:hypothetical protein
VLMAVVVAQGAVGFVQYFTDLPVVLVGFHMLGAALVSAAVTWVLVSVREPVTGPGGGSGSVSETRTDPHSPPAPDPARSQRVTSGSRATETNSSER